MNLESTLPTPARSGQRPWLLFGKITATIALVAWLVGHANWTGMAHRLTGAPVMPLLEGLVLNALGVGFASGRWRAACRAANVALTWTEALMLMTASLFFGQILPGAIGGDAVRGWLTWRGRDRSPSAVILALVLDRLLALLGVCLLFFAGLPRLAAVVPPEMAWMLPALVLLGVAGFAAGLLVDRLPLPAGLRAHRLVTAAFTLVARLRAAFLTVATMKALGHSVLVHLCTLTATLLYADAIGLSVGPLDVLAVMPTAIIATALPISLNGWGVREGTMVAGFALFGVSFEDALLLSLMIGLSVTLTALPGGLAWLALSRGSQSAPGNAVADRTHDH